jgi:hypothetical protein
MIDRVMNTTLRRFLARHRTPWGPRSLGRIHILELRHLLASAFPEAQVVVPGRYIHVGDWDYELTSRHEWLRFLRWYRDRHPYTYDEYDCEVFAWVMRAEALKWMHGKFVFGHIIAEGIDEEHKFENHGFCFIVDQHRRIYFCDELQLAAPRDELIEAYPVRAQKVET